MTSTALLDAPATAPFGRDGYAQFEDLNEDFTPAVPGIGDGTPVILATDEQRRLTYTWYDQSPRKQDWHSRERGFLVSRLSVTYTPADGSAPVEVGYLNVTHTTPELVADVFPTPFHFADENTSASFGFRYRNEVTPADMWATVYTHLRRELRAPSAADKTCWGAYSKSDAPTDPDVLANELATAEKVYARQMRGFVRWLSNPFVDYSKVKHTMTDENGHHLTHGAGIGTRMYLLAAQHLAARGKVLRGSGIQTGHAQGLWQRLVTDPAVPTRKTRITFYKPTAEQTSTYWCLDYTRTPRG